MATATAPQVTGTADSSLLWGTWRMVSWTREMTATGEVSDALGPNPWGWITYTPEGRVLVLVVRSGRSTPPQMPPTDQEKLALFDSMLAYAGTYTVEEGKIVHRLEASWNQAWTGTEQIRFRRLDGETLKLWTPVMKDPAPGGDSVHTIVFEKMK